jgi:hypothetical protein
VKKVLVMTPDIFSDPITSSLISSEEGEYQLDIKEQQKYFDHSISFADNLQQLHGIKPFNKKKRVIHKYTGRGALNILATMEASMALGHYQLMESRKVRMNPERPHIAILQDTSASIGNQGLTRIVILLGAMFVEFFGRGFAQDISVVSVGSAPARAFLNTSYEDAKRFIIGEHYRDPDNDFSLAIGELEQGGFFDKPNTQYVVVITDGVPEVHEKGAYSWTEEGWELTLRDTERLIYYIQERWTGNPKVEYFWVQVGEYANVLDFCQTFGGLPPKEQLVPPFSESEYSEAIKLSANKKEAWTKWSKFFLEMYRKGDVFYASINDWKTGKGFHSMIEYFLQKFQKRLKI